MFGRISLPQGVRDFPPDRAEEIRRVEECLLEEFLRWGYRRVITPLFEFLDTISVGLGDELKEKILKFVDPSTGEVVALRPDITPQVVRIVATQLRNHTPPLRLCYNGRVVRYEEKGSGKEREVFQVGCELIGLSSPEADAEIIALAVKSLSRLGIKDVVVDIGHNGLLRFLLQSVENAREIRESLKKKDQEALERTIKKTSFPKEIKEAFLLLPELYGSREILDKAKRVKILKKYVKQLEEVLNIVDEFQLNCNFNIDLTELRGFNYYTGVTFEIISPSSLSPLLRGGRYDELTGRYGYDSAATGFAVDVESVLGVIKTRINEDNHIHFAVIPSRTSLRPDAIRLAEWLRSSGFRVILDLRMDSRLRREKDFSNLNCYGIILLESKKKIRMIELRSGTKREFSNLEELLKEGGI
ncbi:ATP phosphoribosyltransferase regulatory subunit [bacterium HR37]|jgi:ATP phosphoribosyltransferase regulatory subunit|nr:ATP phosphoribosyltransferase regulatory subunit [bacterium HR37]